MLYYILDDEMNPHGVSSIEEYLQWAKDKTEDFYRVARDEKDGIVVSTVFLRGMNHEYMKGGLLLWETMIFGGEHDQWMDRYGTYAGALEGHERAKEIAFGIK